MSEEFSASEKADLRSWGLGQPLGQIHITCPACSPTRRNSKQRCLSVNIKGDHMVMACHHCGRAGAVRLVDDMRKPFIPPIYEKPKPQALKALQKGLTEAGIKFVAGRHLSLQTAQAYDCVSSRAWFRELNREEDAIALPYFVKGKADGHKVRCIVDKQHICDKPLSSLFGIQLVDLTESEDLIICEGEWDAMSYLEAGVLNATSVPNGSNSFTKNNEEGDMRQQMGFLWNARDKIEQAKRILISSDADDPGEKLAEELARRIGRHRCWLIKYPEGCKDANDVLVRHGKAALVECYSTATPYPVDGLFEADKYFAEVDELFVNGFGERVTTGLSAVDELFSVGPGLLTVVTGIPGSGKSTFVDQIMVNLAREKQYVSAICSFENPAPVHIGKIAQMLYQTHFFKTQLPGEYMTQQELDAAKPFIHRHFKFLQQDDGKKATIGSIIERIKTAVFRWGIKIAVIDPYNYIQRPPKEESETSWIDDMLTQLRLTAQLYGLHIFFVAHPTKMPQDSEGNYAIPKGYAISGSAAWFSKPDFGLTVHRVGTTGEVKIVNWKTRYDWLGTVGERSILYDNIRHTFTSDNWADQQPYGSDE